MAEKQLFKTGDLAPVSGNYQFFKHEKEVRDCVPRVGAYLHLRKGMKLPAHDDCLQDCIYSLMTITNEEGDPKILGM
jgi:hypothetical protein